MSKRNYGELTDFLKMMENQINGNSTREASRQGKAEKEKRARERMRRDNPKSSFVQRDGPADDTLLADFFRDYNIPNVVIPHYQYDVLDRAMNASNADVLSGYHVEIPTTEAPDMETGRHSTVDRSTDDDWNAPSKHNWL